MAIISLSTRSHGRYLHMISCNEQIWDHINELSLYGKTTQGVMKTQTDNKSNTRTIFRIEYIKHENMLRNLATSIFLKERSFWPIITRLYRFGLLTESKVERLPEFRDGFLKEYSYYQHNRTNQVLLIQGTDDETDIFQNCVVWDFMHHRKTVPLDPWKWNR
jgi:hypothetical protein